MKKKINYNKGRFNILTTLVDGFEYSDYVEYCKENGLEPQGKESHDYFRWCEDETEMNFEADLDNIEGHSAYNVPVIMTGTIGRWNGDFEIVPVVCKSVFSAIDMCRGKDILDIEVFFDDGKIEVAAHHHDSTNHFTIRALSKKGRTRWTMADYGYDKVSMEGMTADDIKKADTKRFKYIYA